MKTEFKAVAMPCTKEQFEEMLPTLEKGGCNIKLISNFFVCGYLTNNGGGLTKTITNITETSVTHYNRTPIPYSPNEFYKACGIELPKYDLSKLTPEIVEELIKEPNIHEMFVRIGVVKNEIPFGSWVVNELFKNELIKYNENEVYGIGAEGRWIVGNSGLNPNRDKNNRIATPEEVTKRLIEYAKETYKSKTAKCLHGCLEFNFEKHSDSFWFDGSCLRYKSSTRVGCILDLDMGKWSEPIHPETYIKIPLSEIKATPNDCDLGKLVRQIAG